MNRSVGTKSLCSAKYGSRVVLLEDSKDVACIANTCLCEYAPNIKAPGFACIVLSETVNLYSDVVSSGP